MSDTFQKAGSSDPVVSDILKKSKTIAIVGLSPKADRDSNKVGVYLLEAGYRIFPVNPACDTILGQKCYGRLADIPEPVDVVDIFRRPEDILGIVDEAIAVGAGTVWMQLGLRHPEAAEKARGAGLKVVMDRCMKVEHLRLHSPGQPDKS